MHANSILKSLKGGLIVSCQAMPDEPLFGSDIMAKMALAAKMGGASGIRANSPSDVTTIKENIDLPLIGLWKRKYSDSEVYITPTLKETEIILEAGANIIAMDATIRERPKTEQLADIVQHLKTEHSCLLMADISTVEEGIRAEKMGFDIISTTLSGYTPYSPQEVEPDFKLVEELSAQLSVPVFAEGRIHAPEQAVRCFELGAYSVVVGGAITRPQNITKRYVDTINSYWKRY